MMFNSIFDQFGSFWLDSTLRFSDRGRYSFIGELPSYYLYKYKNKTVLKNYKSKIVLSDIDFFEVLQSLTKKDDKFAVGYFSYESSLEFLGLKRRDENILPDAAFFFYDFVYIYDHDEKKWLDKNYQPISEENLIQSSDIDFSSDQGLIPLTIKKISESKYKDQIRKIKSHIKEGDIYQANFTSKFEIEYRVHPYDVYCKLRNINRAPYGCYINFNDFKILSSSPERMFYLNNNYITSSPIKGTIKRGNSRTEEAIQLNKLINSDKDKAELLMIVDLIRNDLGKIAQPGSVTVDSIFKPEIYSNLIHLVSDISATLKPDINIKDIIQAILPGGSITGAPKKRAVEILLDCEDQSREVYTGCIGYIHQKKADFNIAIRTIYHRDNKFYLHGGGGIVADSDEKSEYNEMMLKVSNLLKALGVANG